MCSAIWYLLHNLKNAKNINEGVVLDCTNDTKSCKTSHIEKAFELNNIQRHPNDQDSVLS